MSDTDKPHEELLREMQALRQRVEELEERERELQRVDEALRESEEKWRKVVETVPDIITMLDRQGTILFINRVLPGYQLDQVVGRSTYDYVPAPYRERLRQANERVFETGEPFELEVLGDGSPGERRYYVTRGNAIQRDGQVVATHKVSTDITKRKQNEERIRASLEEKESLLQEIHHRVKNNLQIISSLLALQADRIEDPATLSVFRESRDRVRAMAIVHESLYRSSDLGRIDLGHHVEDLCANLFRSYGVDPKRIELDLRLADARLDMDHAVHCGLLLNELVSNALKHAFPGERRGRVRVALDAGAAGEYTLLVGDNGVGLPQDLDVSHTSSLGLQLVDTLIRQLKGRLTVDRADGTTFRITFTIRDSSSR